MSDTMGSGLSMPQVAALLKRAAASGVFRGYASDMAYLARCTIDHFETGSRVLFTRDTGHHTSGWLKNPDYERCFHLSLSFFDPEAVRQASRAWQLGLEIPAPGLLVTRPFEPRLAARWVKLFFGPHRRLVWEEGPKSSEGRALDVHHYRLFCDERWQPIKPRGEVYSTEFTELGWRSWSEVQAHEMSETMQSAC